MLCSVMVPAQLSGPCSDVGWMRGWHWVWRAQTLLGFFLCWMDRLGSWVWVVSALLFFIVAKGAIFPFG